MSKARKLASFQPGCVLMTVLAASEAYHYPDAYSVTDEIDEDEDDASEEAPPSREDYTKYFSGSGGVAAPHTAQTAADSSTGFVQPIDFSHLFAGGSFGAPDTIRGIVAPPTASNVFAIHAAPVIHGFLPGMIPSIAASATNNNQSSHVGFINPNPNVELRALFDASRAPTGSVYQKQPFYNQFPHPAAVIGQPVPSYSMYLPHFESIKGSVSKDVLNGQRQVSQASQNSKQKTNPQRSVENDEYYDSQEDEGESEEDREDEEDGNDEEEDTYVYDQTEQKAPARQASPSESRPGKSKYPKKQQTGNPKKSAFANPYPYNRAESLLANTYIKQNQGGKQKGANNKGLVSPGVNNRYSSVFEYPPTSLDNVSMKNKKNAGQATNHRPITSLNNKQILPVSSLHGGNKGFAHVPYPHNEPTIFPTFPLSTPAQYAANSQPIKSIYSYNPKPVAPVSLQGGFIPSASIPFAKDFPSSYKIPYTSPIPLQAMPSSILPSDPQIKADSSEVAKNTKKCTKIEKKPDKENGDTSADQNMVCYKCYDTATGANYEQCSYESQTKSKPYYETDYEAIKAEKNLKQVTPRSKREVGNEPFDFSFSKDMNVGQSVTLIRKVREYTEYDDSPHNYETPYSTEDSDNYRFGPEYFVSSEDSPEGDATQEVIESDSGEQCKKVNKDGVVCMVCQKPTGGLYEQCSYASDPKENSYSYGTSRSYSHGSKPKTTRTRRFTSMFDDQASDKIKRKEKLKRKVRRNNEVKQTPKTEASEKIEEEYEENYDAPEDFSESIARIRKAERNGKLVGLDPYFYGSSDSTFHPEETKTTEKVEEDETDDEEKAGTSEKPKKLTYDDYFARLFPEFETEATEKKETPTERSDGEEYDGPNDYSEDEEEEGETKQTKKKVPPGFESKSVIPDYFDDAEQRKDLEMVLGEFKQKDRSACKKVMRDKMTCYQCLDDKGMQHEECMFVAASEPKNKHLAYHEVKQFRITPSKDAQSVNKIDDTLDNKKPIRYDERRRQADNEGDNNNEEPVDNDHHTSNQRSVPDDFSDPAPSNPVSVNVDNDSHAAENLDIMRLHPKESKTFPMSTLTIQNQRYFSSTGSPKNGGKFIDSSTRRKRLPIEDHIAASESKRSHRRTPPPDRDEDYEERPVEKGDNPKRKQKNPSKTPYNAIPTDPPAFDKREGPEGAYSDDTEPAFDTVLKITLPRYMLERSEHEAIFDEVLASG